jgi:hypothetical protein
MPSASVLTVCPSAKKRLRADGHAASSAVEFQTGKRLIAPLHCDCAI